MKVVIPTQALDLALIWCVWPAFKSLFSTALVGPEWSNMLGLDPISTARVRARRGSLLYRFGSSPC